MTITKDTKILPANHKIYHADYLKFSKSKKNLIIQVGIDHTGNTFKVSLDDVIKFCGGR